MDEITKAKANARLKRVAGQVAGIQRMVDEDRCCVDILLQVTAVQAALMEAGRFILSGHFEHGLTDAMKSHDERDRRKKIDALVELFSRFCRIESVLAEGLPAGSAPAPRVPGRRR